ncbi:MAG: hypothetical protein Q6361_07160 [Candidatus Hermodarchaeota archaeon]|nr:hypothetical protein [Candidatus Hermodarchaeota archaeon]
MPIFRTDLYITIRVSDYNLDESSEVLFQVLKNVSDLRNVNMAKVRKDREEQGKIRIEEWDEITGSINVPEGGKSFWALSKESSEREPYNFFIRIDRNTDANNYEIAQSEASDWVQEVFIQPLEAKLGLEEKHISPPDQLSKISEIFG